MTPIYQSLAIKEEKRAWRKARRRKASLSQLIGARIEELGDWRGKLLSRLRSLVKEADPEDAEEWKWRGVPVWEHDGIICTGETYENILKMTFAKGRFCKILRTSSTPFLTGAQGVPSTSTRARR
jgi:hypothetical protein